MIKNVGIYFLDRVYEDQSEQFNLNMCIQKAFGESPTYCRWIQGLLKGKHRRLLDMPQRIFLNHLNTSVDLELAEESLAVDFGFIEVIEIFYS